MRVSSSDATYFYSRCARCETALTACGALGLGNPRAMEYLDPAARRLGAAVLWLRLNSRIYWRALLSTQQVHAFSLSVAVAPTREFLRET